MLALCAGPQRFGLDLQDAPAGFLGFVHCRVGCTQQAIPGCAIIGIERNSDARRSRNLGPSQFEWASKQPSSRVATSVLPMFVMIASVVTRSPGAPCAQVFDATRNVKQIASRFMDIRLPIRHIGKMTGKINGMTVRRSGKGGTYAHPPTGRSR